MKKIIFLSSALQQPRHQKRIDLLSRYYEVDIYYYKRNKYCENYKGYVNRARSLGVVDDGRYFKRLFLVFKLYLILVKSHASIVYCTSPEQMVVACLARKKVFFEVGDLYQVDGRNRFFSVLDKLFIKRVSCLILTSPFFYDGYYSRFKKHLKDKVLVIENKLPPYLAREISEFRSNIYPVEALKKVRLGVIGSLSSRDSLLAIRRLMESREDLELHVYGDGLYDVFNGVANIQYHGRFKNPEDLFSIYSSVDINIILYDAANNNVKLALPNKLYESIAFLKPIICSPDVALSKIVVSKQYGVSASGANLASAIQEISCKYQYYVDQLIMADSSEYLCYEQSQIIKKLEFFFDSKGGKDV